MRLRTFYIKTFGCQMNMHDSERMRGLLSSHGLMEAQNYQEADVVLINTCSVRGKSEHKVYSELGNLCAMKKNQPGKVLGVCGCVAQAEQNKLLERFPKLDLVIGTKGIPNLIELIEQAANNGRRAAFTPLQGSNTLVPADTVARYNPVVSWVTIMEGCDNYCSYCIVPYVRGRETSRTMDDIIAEVRWLASNGYKEVDLLGQNVNSYGNDLGEHGVSFAELLERLNQVEGILRIRFFTSHPKDLSEELARAMARCDKVCNQLHLPAQAGSTSVLEAMKRGYTREDYLEKIRMLREIIPGISLSSDFIVGFPGESDHDFQQTLSLVEEVDYDYIYAFVYSPRPGTAAARLDDDVPADIKRKRIIKLLELQKRRNIAAHNRLVGTIQEVLVNGFSKKGKDKYCGRTAGNLSVNIIDKVNIGDLVQVRIIEATPNSLIATTRL